MQLVNVKLVKTFKQNQKMNWEQIFMDNFIRLYLVFRLSFWSGRVNPANLFLKNTWKVLTKPLLWQINTGITKSPLFLYGVNIWKWHGMNSKFWQNADVRSNLLKVPRYVEDTLRSCLYLGNLPSFCNVWLLFGREHLCCEPSDERAISWLITRFLQCSYFHLWSYKSETR